MSQICCLLLGSYNCESTITKQLEPSSGNIIRDMLSRSSSSAKEKAMIEQAQALGVPLERLKAAQGFVRPVDTVNATYDMSKLRPPKTFAQQEDDAKAKALLAAKNKDDVALGSANAELVVIKSIKDNMSSEQTKFSEKIVTLKNASLN
jgi:hypothetical protein